MTVYRLPAHVSAILFDIDGTLYTDLEYARFQIDILIDELARRRGQPREAIIDAIDRVRAGHASNNGGATTSLGNAMAALGIDIETSVELRRRLIDPSRFLSPDPRLRTTLELMSRGNVDGPLTLVAVTNNPRSVGEATLEALGVPDLFRRVVGLDDTMKSKPASEPWLLAARAAGCDPAACVAVGDRYDVDLADPLKLGMGAILVDGVEDVYLLPGKLFPT